MSPHPRRSSPRCAGDDTIGAVGVDSAEVRRHLADSNAASDIALDPVTSGVQRKDAACSGDPLLASHSLSGGFGVAGIVFPPATREQGRALRSLTPRVGWRSPSVAVAELREENPAHPAGQRGSSRVATAHADRRRSVRQGEDPGVCTPSVPSRRTHPAQTRPKGCKDAPQYAAVMSLAVPSLLGMPELTRTQRSLLAVGLCVLLALGAAGVGVLAARSRPATVRPACRGARARAGRDRCVEVGADAALVPGSRVLAGMPDSLALARQQADWLAAGTVPQVPGLDGDLVRDRAAGPACAEPGLRRTGGRLDARLALRLAAGLGLRRVGPGPDRSPGRRRADPGLPGPGAAGVRRVPGALPAGRAVAYRTIAAFSWTGSAGRCGRAPRWRPRSRSPSGPRSSRGTGP